MKHRHSCWWIHFILLSYFLIAPIKGQSGLLDSIDANMLLTFKKVKQLVFFFFSFVLFYFAYLFLLVIKFNFWTITCNKQSTRHQQDY